MRERLNKRGDNPEEAERRLKADREDFANISELVDFSFSNDLGISVDALGVLIHTTYSHAINNKNKQGA